MLGDTKEFYNDMADDEASPAPGLRIPAPRGREGGVQSRGGHPVRTDGQGEDHLGARRQAAAAFYRGALSAGRAGKITSGHAARLLRRGRKGAMRAAGAAGMPALN